MLFGDPPFRGDTLLDLQRNVEQGLRLPPEPFASTPYLECESRTSMMPEGLGTAPRRYPERPLCGRAPAAAARGPRGPHLLAGLLLPSVHLPGLWAVEDVMIGIYVCGM